MDRCEVCCVETGQHLGRVEHRLHLKGRPPKEGSGEEAKVECDGNAHLYRELFTRQSPVTTYPFSFRLETRNLFSSCRSPKA